MTLKQMALSRLARLALNAASESSPQAKAEVYQIISAALHDDCPDLALSAAQTANHFNCAQESESDLLFQLTP